MTGQLPPVLAEASGTSKAFKWGIYLDSESFLHIWSIICCLVWKNKSLRVFCSVKAGWISVSIIFCSVVSWNVQPEYLHANWSMGEECVKTSYLKRQHNLRRLLCMQQNCAVSVQTACSYSEGRVRMIRGIFSQVERWRDCVELKLNVVTCRMEQSLHPEITGRDFFILWCDTVTSIIWKRKREKLHLHAPFCSLTLF